MARRGDLRTCNLTSGCKVESGAPVIWDMDDFEQTKNCGGDTAVWESMKSVSCWLILDGI